MAAINVKLMNKELENLPEEALRRAPVWNSFLAKNKKRIEKMDTTIHALHYKWSERIDCLSCGNCCRVLGPRLTDKDVERLAKATRMKPAAFISQYLRVDEDGDRVFQSMPCPFLGDDNHCAVYDSRPKACREYPHTDRKKFYQLYKLSVKNAETCPIVYRVLDELVTL